MVAFFFNHTLKGLIQRQAQLLYSGIIDQNFAYILKLFTFMRLRENS